jgi:uncharacterized protein
MTDLRLELLLQSDRLAVCKLAREASIPAWATQGVFWSITRTPDEFSVVCPEASVPKDVRAESGWRGLRVAGMMHFSVVGALANLCTSLAEAGVSVFAISTFDTDYLLIKEHDLGRAVEALEKQGHSVLRVNG